MRITLKLYDCNDFVFKFISRHNSWWVENILKDWLSPQTYFICQVLMPPFFPPLILSLKGVLQVALSKRSSLFLHDHTSATKKNHSSHLSFHTLPASYLLWRPLHTLRHNVCRISDWRCVWHNWWDGYHTHKVNEIQFLRWITGRSVYYLLRYDGSRQYRIRNYDLFS